ncbi:DoxX family protein [Roseivirga sp. E12]|uniref:DoxX family protein n=1 Tax=Roseivirga sp. E12 TaxID=2819237 RepID=UPI001ABCCB2F|nr:DoxX family protein [Roseivirga sp. E12]MBO3699376.1 DoxX family protein [Roseivirga sp. E12]
MLNKTIVAFFARVLLGIIFLMQGFGKVFTWGFDGVYNSFKPYEETFLPKFLVVFSAYYTSYVELIAGALLVIGLFKNYALYALASVLLIVSFGHGLSSPIWNLNDVMWRSILLIFLLVIPKEWDKWQVENIMRPKRQ